MSILRLSPVEIIIDKNVAIYTYSPRIHTEASEYELRIIAMTIEAGPRPISISNPPTSKGYKKTEDDRPPFRTLMEFTQRLKSLVSKLWVRQSAYLPRFLAIDRNISMPSSPARRRSWEAGAAAGEADAAAGVEGAEGCAAKELAAGATGAAGTT